MTRAGEKLYPQPDEPHGSVLWAFISHPLFLRGMWDVTRLLVVVALLVALFELDLDLPLNLAPPATPPSYPERNSRDAHPVSGVRNAKRGEFRDERLRDGVCILGRAN